MGFVDGNQRNIDFAEQRESAGLFPQQPFGRQVEQVQFPAPQRSVDSPLFIVGNG